MPNWLDLGKINLLLIAISWDREKQKPIKTTPSLPETPLSPRLNFISSPSTIHPERLRGKRNGGLPVPHNGPVCCPFLLTPSPAPLWQSLENHHLLLSFWGLQGYRTFCPPHTIPPLTQLWGWSEVAPAADGVLRNQNTSKNQPANSASFHQKLISSAPTTPPGRREVGLLCWDQMWATFRSREALFYFLYYFISGLASSIVKAWNPVDPPLLAPPEIELMLNRAPTHLVPCAEPVLGVD